MLKGPSARMAREIPLTVLAKFQGQEMISPLRRNRSETADINNSFMYLQYSLDH
jgi:hypothetical protein